MLPRADITGTRPLASIGAPAPVTSSTDARQEIYHRLTQIALGSQLQAEVLSRLADGTFLVRIADTNARMNLPNGTRVGDSLQMTMLALQPRPTFLLGLDSGSATTTLSSAGRLIDSLLQSAQQQGAPTALIGKTALAASPAVLASAGGVLQIATALHDTLGSSGLFYESHLSEWANGGRAIAQLMEEPQAQAATAAPPASAPPAVGHNELARLIDQLRELVGGDRSLADLLRGSQLLTDPASTTDADTIAAGFKPGTMSAEAMQLINLQLNTLEQKQVLWQGELFSGQPLEWAVGEDTPHGDRENTPSSWHSSVRFELPLLGEVSATIRLIGERVQVQVSTATEAAAASLRAHGGELADALGAAGSPLDSLLVKQDEKA